MPLAVDGVSAAVVPAAGTPHSANEAFVMAQSKEEIASRRCTRRWRDRYLPVTGARDARCDRMGGAQPILMETVTEPRAGKPGATLALQPKKRALRRVCILVDDRVLVAEFAQYGSWRRLERRIERHDDWRCERQRLQAIEKIADSDSARAVGIVTGQIIPCRPCTPRLRQQRPVRVRHDAVRLIADSLEEMRFERRRVGQDRARLIAVAREHDVIEMLGAAGGGYFGTVRRPPHARHRRRNPPIG